VLDRSVALVEDFPELEIDAFEIRRQLAVSAGRESGEDAVRGFRLRCSRDGGSWLTSDPAD
jgi:hypothetical protein